MAKKKLLIYSLIVWVIINILAIHPVINSTLIQHQSYVAMYAVVAAVSLIGLLMVYKLKLDSFNSYALTFFSVLIIGNTAALPLLRYTSEYPVADVIDYTKGIALNSVVSAFAIPLIWVLLILIEKIQKKHPKVLLITCSLLCVLLGGITTLFSNTSTNTAIVFGVVIAIPVLISAVITLGVSIQNSGWKIIVSICAIVFSISALVVRSETGIPILFYISVAIWYLLFYPYAKKKWLMITLAALPIIAFGVIYLFKIFESRLPTIPFVTQLLEKIEVRLFADEVSQTNDALRSIADGGLFGNFKYTVYLSAGSSDLVLATITHYLGASFILLMIGTFAPFCISGAKKYMNERNNLANSICSLFFVVYVVMDCYSLLMTFDIFPIVGSQPPFTGSSGSYWLLSSFMLGAMTFNREKTQAILHKLKGVFCYEVR